MDLARTAETPSSEVVFQYTESGKNIAVLQPLVGSSGWLACARMTITALQAEDSVTGSVDDASVAKDLATGPTRRSERIAGRS